MLPLTVLSTVLAKANGLNYKVEMCGSPFSGCYSTIDTATTGSAVNLPGSTWPSARAFDATILVSCTVNYNNGAHTAVFSPPIVFSPGSPTTMCTRLRGCCTLSSHMPGYRFYCCLRRCHVQRCQRCDRCDGRRPWSDNGSVRLLGGPRCARKRVHVVMN